jgi:hypothetical protein
MPRLASRLCIPSLLLALALAPAGISAAERRTEAEPAPRTYSLAFGDLFARFRGGLASLWAEAGCELDPYGHCGNRPSPGGEPEPWRDAGCGLDPYGACIPGQ